MKIFWTLLILFGIFYLFNHRNSDAVLHSDVNLRKEILGTWQRTNEAGLFQFTFNSNGQVDLKAETKGVSGFLASTFTKLAGGMSGVWSINNGYLLIEIDGYNNVAVNEFMNLVFAIGSKPDSKLGDGPIHINGSTMKWNGTVWNKK